MERPLELRHEFDDAQDGHAFAFNIFILRT